MKVFKLFTVMWLLLTTIQFSFATTLCATYGSTFFYLTVGAGTPYPKSSDLGSSNVNYPIYISGDFEIDANCTFLNNIVKVAPGVKITVKPRSYYTFTLDNTKIFACGDLWEGIFVDYSAVLISKNGTQIEDAEKAIFTDQNAYLTVNNTTFNRNNIGIDVNTTYGIPILNISNNVSFTCTSPLNGTVSDISYAGIKTNNFNLTVGSLSSLPVVFDGLQNGIFNETPSVPKSIIGRNLEIKNIEDNGIYLKYGVLDLDGCTFTNNKVRGITIKIAQDIDVRNTDIIYDSNLPVPSSVTLRYGCYIYAFAPSKYDVEFDNVTLDANLSDMTNVILGIYIVGNGVGLEPDILIHNCNFDGHSMAGGGGIIIDNNFPITSHIDIYDNYFTDCNSGIWMINGDKRNVKIFDNEFEANGTSILAVGSTGVGNEIINNTFDDDINISVLLTDFENTNICSNAVTGTNIGLLAFQFSGTNSSTNFQANTITGTQTGINFPAGSLIGIQTHKGNRWFDGVGGQRANKHAICLDPLDALSSKFFVHTAQTVWNGSSYTFFSEYYRENLQPNTTDFFQQTPGSPASTCSSPSITSSTLMARSPEFTNETDRLIAENQILATEHNPARIWNINNYLFKKLKRLPEAIAEYDAFPAFLANQANSSISDLYEVSQIIEQAVVDDNERVLEFEQLQREIRDLIQQRLVISEQMTTTESDENLELLRNQHLELTLELVALQNTYHELSIQYMESLKVQFRLAQNSNNQVRTASIFAQNQKEVNDIYLTAFIEQNGEFTKEQIVQLQTIALHCPKDGGMAVYMARGLLPSEVKEELWNDFPCSDFKYPVVNPSENSEIKSTPLSLSDINVSPSIYPNPSSTAFVINNPEGKGGRITIGDLAGKVLYQERIIESTYQTEVIHNLKGGIYLVSIRFVDGTLVTQKLIVQN